MTIVVGEAIRDSLGQYHHLYTIRQSVLINLLRWISFYFIEIVSNFHVCCSDLYSASPFLPLHLTPMQMHTLALA